jgi:hypothetical protein
MLAQPEADLEGACPPYLVMNDTDVEKTSVSGFKFTKCFDL